MVGYRRVRRPSKDLGFFLVFQDIRQRVEGASPPPEAELALSIISIVGIMLSLVGLTITIFTLLFFK